MGLELQRKNVLITGVSKGIGPAGVRVVGINPGLTKTARIAEGMKMDGASSPTIV